MKLTDILPELNHEYETLLEKARKYFDKWIETGEDNYKERELLHTGAAYATLRIIRIIKSNEGANKC